MEFIKEDGTFDHVRDKQRIVDFNKKVDECRATILSKSMEILPKIYFAQRNDKPYTLRQLSNETGLNYMVVYNHYQKLQYLNIVHLKNKNGKTNLIYVTESGIRLAQISLECASILDSLTKDVKDKFSKYKEQEAQVSQ